ncbi:hypothetical protein INS49_007536 [Diaporthe citri]|uniref:uncharacterized protein n=1 Tax=Diaporthe citri TaxID=83186 RepID=UPI001C7E204C|nr:uncharacterized protein INS49_007536 [Diaporthe citri]KAG6353295.1 hypothetical protein INS49_007536 [Diaporthe citri]
MLWGGPSDINDTSFLNTVKGLVNNGTKISNVLTFNEPEMSENGGSNVSPGYGARVWVNNIIPLQKLGIRAGLPTPAGSERGLPWLEQFLGNCSSITGTQCAYDFVTLHWYGAFEGLASHIGQYAARFPNTSIWVTEYNLNNQSLRDTQVFFKMSAEYLDRLPYIERHSFFGAFRSSVSNVGTNATMLSVGGRLTDIGRWYLGRVGNGVDPNSTDSGSQAPGRRWAVPSSLVLVFLAIILVV